MRVFYRTLVFSCIMTALPYRMTILRRKESIMATFNGQVVLTITKLDAKTPEDLEKALSWLIPVISKEAFNKVSTSKADVSVNIVNTPAGPSGTVSVSGSVAGGTVTGTVTSGPGGTTSSGGSGTWHFSTTTPLK